MKGCPDYFYDDGSSKQATTDFFMADYEFRVGTHIVEYQYKGLTVTASFTVNSALTYTAQVSASTCRYKEQLPTLTIKNSLNQEETDFYKYFISKKSYDALDKTSETYIESLISASYIYESEYSDIVPGDYYLYGINYKNELSSFTPIKINPGYLRIDSDQKGEIYGYFDYGSMLDGYYPSGKIPLKKVSISMPTDNEVRLLDVKGEEWMHYTLEWKYGDTETVDSTNNNTHSVITIVSDAVDFEGEQVKLFEDIDWGPAQLKIEKWGIFPNFTGAVSTEEVYDGSDFTVCFHGNDHYNITIINAVDIYLNDELITPSVQGDYLILGTQSEEGIYNYTFKLKDTVNYVWLNSSFEKTNSSNLTFTFTIQPAH